jgi:RimJ/RimL family protein N-acetyltransferase
MVTWVGERILATPRLTLRTFRGDDLAHYAALNADPEVARWLGGPITRSHSDSIAEWARECYDREGITAGSWQH